MNKSILAIVQFVSNKQLLSQEKIFEILENALSLATQKQYIKKVDIRVSINRKNGDFTTFRRWMVVSNVTEPTREINLELARNKNKLVKLSDFIEDKITSITFDRFTTQKTKQIIFQNVKKLVRLMIIDQFHHQKGKIITGIIKNIQPNYILLSISDNIIATLTKVDLLPKENFRLGDRIRGILYAVHSIGKSINLSVSRSHISLLIELFHIEIPEIKKRIIEIKATARHAGYRSKIAVKTHDENIDAIGSCIGICGARIQAISNELSGERIDILLWDDNPIKLIMNALSPADIFSVIVHKDCYTMDIGVDFENLSQAIGKNGQNTRLVSQLSGWSINIMTVHDVYNKNYKKIHQIRKYFMKYFHFNKNIINSLIHAGCSSLEDILNMSYDDLVNVKGINHILVNTIKKIVHCN